MRSNAEGARQRPRGTPTSYGNKNTYHLKSLKPSKTQAEALDGAFASVRVKQEQEATTTDALVSRGDAETQSTDEPSAP